MKKLTYLLGFRVNEGTEEKPNIVETFAKKSSLCADDMLETVLVAAKREAYNGDVLVEDADDSFEKPTRLDRVEAQTTYTAMMTDTLMED